MLDEMVAAWLNRRDNVLQLNGKPSWENLVNALKEVGHNGIASDIVKSECVDSKTGNQQQTTTGAATQHFITGI